MSSMLHGWAATGRHAEDVVLPVPRLAVATVLAVLPGAALVAWMWFAEPDPQWRPAVLLTLGTAGLITAAWLHVTGGRRVVVHSHYARFADGRRPAVSLTGPRGGSSVPAPAAALLRRNRSGRVCDVYIVPSPVAGATWADGAGPGVSGAGPAGSGAGMRVRCGWLGPGRLAEALTDAGVALHDLGWMQRWEVWQVLPGARSRWYRRPVVGPLLLLGAGLLWPLACYALLDALS